MSKYTKIGKGAAFPNRDKQEGDPKPDFSGPAFEVELGGSTYNVAVAIWKSKAKKTGNDYYSIQLTEVQIDESEKKDSPSESGRKDW
tara:strand:+ start:79 stop:339 length:261 start_codon:yes stop_codon:yes gene_type:complete